MVSNIQRILYANCDIYDWPKNFLEDSLMSENNELLIFLSTITENIINTKIYDFEENKLEELLNLISKLASFFLVKISLDEVKITIS